MRFFTVIACLMCSAAAAGGQQDAGSPWIETRFERVYLRNGNTIDGRLVKNTSGSVVLKLKAGEMEIRRDLIDRVEQIRMRSLKEAPEEVKPQPKAQPVEAAVAPDNAEKPSKPAEPGRATEVVAPNVPKDIKEAIDTTIHSWMAASTESRGDLGAKLEPLPDEAVPYLCALLDQRPRRVPGAPLCEVLGRKKDPSAIPSITRVLENSPLNDRVAAATALGRIATADCLPGLMRALNDPSTPVWRASLEGLGTLAKGDPRVLDQLIRDLPRTTQKTSYALAISGIGGDDAYRALLDLLRGNDDAERMAAMQALSKTLAPADAEFVMPSLSSPNNQVRKEACLLLGTVKYKGAVQPLIELMADDDTGLIINAHKALQQITGETLARDANLWRQWWEVAGKAKFGR